MVTATFLTLHSYRYMFNDWSDMYYQSRFTVYGLPLLEKGKTKLNLLTEYNCLYFYFLSTPYNHFMPMLECRVASLQDLFPGNCAHFIKGEKAQTPHGGAAGSRTPEPPDSAFCQSEGLAIMLCGRPLSQQSIQSFGK